MTEINHFRHRVGTGLHYITDHLQTFADGSVQFGDTSEVCVLLTLEQVLSRNGFGLTVNDLWNAVYPDDFMSDEDLAYILYSAIEFTDNFNPHDPVSIKNIIADLKSIACYALAERAEALFMEAGII